MTSGHIAECPMSAECPGHTGKPKFHCPPLPLSPCTNTPSSELACDIQENDNVSLIELSLIRDVRGPWPHSQNTMGEPFMAYSLTTRVLQLLSLARKTRIASRAHPYAGTRLNGQKRCLIAAKPTEEGLDADAKPLHHEGLETDVKVLRRTQVTPQPGLGEVSSLTMKRPLVKKAANTNIKWSALRHSPATEAALMLPKRLPVISIQARYPCRNSDEVRSPSLVVHKQSSCAKLGAIINTCLPTNLGACFDVPKEQVVNLQCIDSHSPANVYNVVTQPIPAGPLVPQRTCGTFSRHKDRHPTIAVLPTGISCKFLRH